MFIQTLKFFFVEIAIEEIKEVNGKELNISLNLPFKTFLLL